MSRAARLLDLLQLLRRHRRPVTGPALAAELGISLRTLYRDIATLQAQGAAIDGEAGIGYLLRPGFTLPPLMFAPEEIEALALGAAWVADRADPRLAAAARDALAKIAAVLPPALRDALDTTTLIIGPGAAPPPEADLPLIRASIRRGEKLAIGYAATERTVWPIALAFFDRVRVLVAWCELRQDFRHFRTDRITALASTGTRYPARRAALMRDWRRGQGIPDGC